jgi:hypothetical protein
VFTTFTSVAIKAVEAQADFAGVFQPTVTAVAQRAGEIDLSVTTDVVSGIPSVIRSTSATLNTSATVTADVGEIEQFDATLSTTATLTANGGVIAPSSASLSTTASAGATLKLIVVDRVIYTIPAESRIYTIPLETRSHTVDQETRTYTIQGD